MDRAPFAAEVGFTGFDDVTAGIVDWPMSVLRLTCEDPDQLVELACRVTDAWRAYTDEAAFIFAETDGEPHNTVTPVARRRGELFEIDLVLRNNITADEHPLGVYHPHAELHHLKKENIGLIEVVGLAVLPPRLEEELAVLSDALLHDTDLESDPRTATHAAWAAGFRDRVTESNVTEVVREEVGLEFARVLEHAGVYKRTDRGLAAFMRFIDAVNG